MKNKGISLIVLIITIIVIIILAGAVILSIASNNPVQEAGEARYKQDLQTLNQRAQMSIAKESLNDITILKRTITDKETVAYYLPEIKGSSYEDRAYIAGGELILKGATLSKEEIKWAKEIHIKIDNLPVIETLLLTVTSTEVTAIISVVENEEIVGYRYRIQGKNSNNEWIDTKELNYTFRGLKPGEEYIVEAMVYTNNAESMITRGVTTTQGISENIDITIQPEDWTKDDVTVTMSHGNIPSGYQLQYKIEGANWIEYSASFSHGTNTNIQARLYNPTTNDEIAGRLANITNIDKELPIIGTMEVEEVTGSEISVVINNASDGISGIKEYEFYLDGTLKVVQVSNTYKYTGLTSKTAYTLSYKVRDNALNTEESSLVQVSTNVLVNYGTTIQSKYTNLYSNKSGNTAIPKGTVDSGNFYAMVGTNSASGPTLAYLHSNYTYEYLIGSPNASVKVGENAFNLFKPVANNWIILRGSFGGISGTYSNVKLVFEDNSEFTIMQAVENNYIEPLVPYFSCYSGAYLVTINESFLTGGNCLGKGWSGFASLIKIKDVAMTALKINSNIKTPDIYTGPCIYIFPDLELSIDPIV